MNAPPDMTNWSDKKKKLYKALVKAYMDFNSYCFDEYVVDQLKKSSEVLNEADKNTA